MIMEIASYSAVWSPAILLNAIKQEGQLLVGYSTIQGNHLLVVRAKEDVRANSEKHAPPSAQFSLDDSTYTFYGLLLPEVVLKENLLRNSHIEVVTRRDIVASFGGEVELADVSESILFNRYRLEGNFKNTPFTIELSPEYSLSFFLAILVLTIITPGMLYILLKIALKILDRKISSPIKDWVVLAFTFMPFILSVLVPAALNYYFTMGSVLLYTGSHLPAMIFSVLIPVMFSLLIVIKVADLFAKGTHQFEQELPENNSRESSFLSGREKWAIFTAAISFFSYLYVVNFTLPLNLQAKITHELPWFSIWFLSLSVI